MKEEAFIIYNGNYGTFLNTNEYTFKDHIRHSTILSNHKTAEIILEQCIRFYPSSSLEVRKIIIEMI